MGPSGRRLARLAAFALLLAAGCASLGDSICEREHDIAAAVGDAGAYFGVPGVLVGRILNLGLTVACGAVTLPIYGTHDLAAAVGIAKPRHSEHATSQPSK
jgi:hypothetical protein